MRYEGASTRSRSISHAMAAAIWSLRRRPSSSRSCAMRNTPLLTLLSAHSWPMLIFSLASSAVIRCSPLYSKTKMRPSASSATKSG